MGGVDCDKTEKKIPECRVLKDGKLEPNQACDINDVNRQELQDFLKAKEIMVKRIDKSNQLKKEMRWMSYLGLMFDTTAGCSRQCNEVSIKGAHGTITEWRHTSDS